MWEILPIQRTFNQGHPGTMIDRDFVYHPYSDVNTAMWKDVPKSVRDWAMSIWKDEFHLRRQPMGETDILAWIPRIGLLAGKRGHWICTSKSFPVVSIYLNYVDRGHRNMGFSGKMITSICRKITDLWGAIPFMFEIQGTIPRGLQSVPPFLTFEYTWIPFLSIQIPPKWTPIPTSEFDSLRGFHPLESDGYKAFKYNDNRILLDSHNDIVFYDNLLSLSTFDGLHIPGAYCRTFMPLGSTNIFLANLHFDPMPAFEHFILA
jgi:hypothetical protein